MVTQYKRVPVDVLKSMNKIVTYSFKNECTHFEEEYDVEYNPDKDCFIDQDTGKEIPVNSYKPGKGHIFMEILKVNDYLQKMGGK